MKKFGIILGLTVLVFMIVSLVDTWHSGSLEKRAMSLKQGSSKAEVQKVLGRPTHVFVPRSTTNFVEWILSVRSETWAYGGWSDVPAAFRGQFPIRWRMFGPDPDELSVVFDTTGRVSQVCIPNHAQ